MGRAADVFGVRDGEAGDGMMRYASPFAVPSVRISFRSLQFLRLSCQTSSAEHYNWRSGGTPLTPAASRSFTPRINDCASSSLTAARTLH